MWAHRLDGSCQNPGVSQRARARAPALVCTHAGGKGFLLANHLPRHGPRPEPPHHHLRGRVKTGAVGAYHGAGRTVKSRRCKRRRGGLGEQQSAGRPSCVEDDEGQKKKMSVVAFRGPLLALKRASESLRCCRGFHCSGEGSETR